MGKLSDVIAKHVSKGQELVIEGMLNNRSYEDKDGNKKYITEILMNEFLFIGSKTKEETTSF